MAKKKNINNKTITTIGTVYLCGISYDDFSDGGFDVFAVCKSRESAKIKVQEEFNNLMEEYRNHPQFFCKKPSINNYDIREMALYQ